MTQPIQQPNSTNINRNLPAMSAVLPCKPGEGQEINQFVAVLRGYPPASTAEAWPADSEEACRRHADFLAVWLKMPQIGKAEMRCSLKKANSKLSASEQKAIANAMMGAKTWLNRKKKHEDWRENTTSLPEAAAGLRWPRQRPAWRRKQQPQEEEWEPARTAAQPEEGKSRYHHCGSC